MLLKFKQIGRVAGWILALSLMGTLARGQAPAVLEQIPDDAVAVLVVKNVNALKTQISNYAKAMNAPMPPDPLAMPLQALGINAGFDATGSIAVVQVKMPPVGAQPSGDPQVPFIFLLPTSDAKALLAGMTPGEAADNITPIAFKTGMGGYAAIVGKFVAIGMNRAMMSEFLLHKGKMDKPGPELLKAFATDDLIIWIAVPDEAKVLGPLWKSFSPMMRAQMRQQNAGSTNMDAIIDMYEALGATLATDVQQILIAGKINDAGITFSTTGIFVPGTPLAKFAAAQKAIPPATLTGVPAEDYSMAGALNWDPAFLTAAMSKMMDMGMTINPILQENPEAQAKAKELAAQIFPLETGMRFSAKFPTGKLSAFSYAMVIDTKEPQKVLDLSVNCAKQMTSSTGDIHYTVQVQPDALKVKGISLTQVTTKINLREETPDSPLPRMVKTQFEAMRRMIPWDGMLSYYGIVGGKVVAIVGRDPQMIEQTISSIQDNKNNFAAMQDASLKAFALPDATALMYLRIDHLADFAKAATDASGLTVATAAATAPHDDALLPLIVSMKAGDQSATIQVALPKETLVKMVNKAQGDHTQSVEPIAPIAP